MRADLAAAQAEHRPQGFRSDLELPADGRKLSDEGGDGGNSTNYLLRRVARERPDVLARWTTPKHTWRSSRATRKGELTALERGLHALNRPKDATTGKQLDLKAYATKIGRAQQSLDMEVQAAKVKTAVLHVQYDLSGYWRQLREIHAARSWLWPLLVSAMLPTKAI